MFLPRPRCSGRGRKEAAGETREVMVEEEEAGGGEKDAEEEREQKKENEGRG